MRLFPRADGLTLTSLDGSITVVGSGGTYDLSVSSAEEDFFWKIGGNSPGGASDLGTGDASDVNLIRNGAAIARLNSNSTFSVFYGGLTTTFDDQALNVMRSIGVEGDGTVLPSVRFEVAAGGAAPATPTLGIVQYVDRSHGDNTLFWLDESGREFAISFANLSTGNTTAAFPSGISTGTHNFVFEDTTQTLTNKTITSSSNTITITPSSLVYGGSPADNRVTYFNTAGTFQDWAVPGSNQIWYSDSSSAHNLTSSNGLRYSDSLGFIVQPSTRTDTTPAMRMDVTFNHASNVMGAWRVNVTNTLSPATSTVFDYQVGSATKFQMNIGGQAGLGGAPDTSWGSRFQIVTGLSSGANQYKCIIMADNVTNNTAKGGMFFGAPYATANKPWTGFGTYTNSTEKGIYLGGGGWSTPDANAIYLHTAPTFTETNNTGVLRLKIFPDGHSVFSTAAVATANYGTVSIGSGAFDGSTSGFFAGSSSGTSIAVNEVSGYAGDLFNFQVGGSLKGRLKSNGDLQVGNDLYVVSGRFFGVGSNSTATQGMFMKSPSDGVFTVYNGGVSDFGRMQFGGTTSSFPALKRSTTDLQVRLADDSAFTAIQSLYHTYGSGSPEGVVTRPVGAIYSRTDGGAGTSLYVKESGTGNTGWVAK